MYSVGQRLKWKLARGTSFIQTETGQTACREFGFYECLVKIAVKKILIKMLEERQSLYSLNEKHNITELSFYKEATRGTWGNRDEGQRC